VLRTWPVWLLTSIAALVLGAQSGTTETSPPPSVNTSAEATYGPTASPTTLPVPETSPPPEEAPPVTVEAAPAPPPSPPEPVQARQEWPVSLQPCDGDYPPCWVANRESHGDYSAVNPAGYYGKWQFSQSTWNSVARSVNRGDLAEVRPDQASPSDQDFLAMVLWDGGRGCSHWAACA
jgi:hypothetical protein